MGEDDGGVDGHAAAPVGSSSSSIPDGLDRELVALVEAMGVEPETISRAETGSISLSLTNLACLADRLGVSMADVVGLDALPAPQQAPDVAELLRIYAGLDEAGRRAVLGAARGVAREERG